MAVLAIGAVGAAVGSAFGYAALGFTIATTAYNMWSSSRQVFRSEGPRLQNLQVQGAQFGAELPRLYGKMRREGWVIWNPDMIEVGNTETSGGKGGPKYQNTTYAYFANFAVALADCRGTGTIAAISRIWANGKLIYDVSSDATAESYAASSALKIRFYTGSTTQQPDPLIESYKGVGNASAYRGTCYVVFEQFAVGDYGNAIPNLTFEVISSGSGTKNAIKLFNRFSDTTFTGSSPATLRHSAGLVQQFSLPSQLPQSKFLMDSRSRDLSGALQRNSVIPIQPKPAGTAGTDNAWFAGDGEHVLYPWAGPGTGTQYYIQVIDMRGLPIGLFTRTKNTDSTEQFGSVGRYYDRILFRSDGLTDNGRLWFIDVNSGSASGVMSGFSRNYAEDTNDLSFVQVGKYCAVMRCNHYNASNDLRMRGWYLDYMLTLQYLPGTDWNNYRMVGVDGDYLMVQMASGAEQNWIYRVTFPGLVIVDKYQFNEAIIGATYRGAQLSVVDGVMCNWRGAYQLRNTPNASVVYLPDVVTSECAISGVNATQLDLTGIAGKPVLGYTATGTARQGLEPLESAYVFDFIESGTKVKATPRGGAVAATINEDSLVMTQ
ncbi:hypothetical protein [Chitiniphilus eburneus]|uniref:hypothetical protein n=1 Tax=Chitiniphilus eburneus TaxID=2571148 RepID=UPI0035CF815C